MLRTAKLLSVELSSTTTPKLLSTEVLTLSTVIELRWSLLAAWSNSSGLVLEKVPPPIILNADAPIAIEAPSYVRAFVWAISNVDGARCSILELIVISLSISSKPPFSFILAFPVSKPLDKLRTPPESILTPPFSINDVEFCTINPFGLFSFNSSDSEKDPACPPSVSILLFRVSALKESAWSLESIASLLSSRFVFVLVKLPPVLVKSPPIIKVAVSAANSPPDCPNVPLRTREEPLVTDIKPFPERELPVGSVRVPPVE